VAVLEEKICGHFDTYILRSRCPSCHPVNSVRVSSWFTVLFMFQSVHVHRCFCLNTSWLVWLTMKVVFFQFLNLETSVALTSTPVNTKERQSLFSAKKLVLINCLWLEQCLDTPVCWTDRWAFNHSWFSTCLFSCTNALAACWPIKKMLVSKLWSVLAHYW